MASGDLDAVLASFVASLPSTARVIEVIERGAAVGVRVAVRTGETQQGLRDACDMISNARDGKPVDVTLIARGKHGTPSAKPRSEGLARLGVTVKSPKSSTNVDDDTDQSAETQERRVTKIAINGMQRMLETVTDTFAKTHSAMQQTMADLTARLAESESERIAAKKAAEEAAEIAETATAALEKKAGQTSASREMAEGLLVQVGSQLAPDIAEKIRGLLSKALPATSTPAAPTNGASTHTTIETATPATGTADGT